MFMCYAMLCHAMPCYAMLCYAMLCYAMLCYAHHHAIHIVLHTPNCFTPHCIPYIMFSCVIYHMIVYIDSLISGSCRTVCHVAVNMPMLIHLHSWGGTCQAATCWGQIRAYMIQHGSQNGKSCYVWCRACTWHGSWVKGTSQQFLRPRQKP